MIANIPQSMALRQQQRIPILSPVWIHKKKSFSNRDLIRKAEEAFLSSKARALDPDGLNIRQEAH